MFATALVDDNLVLMQKHKQCAWGALCLGCCLMVCTNHKISSSRPRWSSTEFFCNDLSLNLDNMWQHTSSWEGGCSDGQGQDALNYFKWEGQSSWKQIHAKIARQRLLRNNIVLATTLVDMYAKCGVIVKARVFEVLPSWDVVSWFAWICSTRPWWSSIELFWTDHCLDLESLWNRRAVDKGEQNFDDISR